MITTIQDCVNTLKRVGSELRVLLQGDGSTCECQSEQVAATVQASSTCGCGNDACQIGDSVTASTPPKAVTIERQV